MKLAAKMVKLSCEVDGWFGTHLDMMQVENLFALFDTGFDGLSAVVVCKPLGQVLGDRVGAKVEQGTVLDGLANVETLHGHIQWIGTTFEVHSLPGYHLGVVSHPFPEGLLIHLALQVLQHFGLRRVLVALLFEEHCLKLLQQADVLGERTPGNEKSVLSVLTSIVVSAHDRDRPFSLRE